jgi:hypothetical protein
MSTISKLDPRIRERRTARAMLLKALAEEESNAIKQGRHNLAGKLVGARDFLAAVKRCPWRTGAKKEQLFKRIALELRDAYGNP